MARLIAKLFDFLSNWESFLLAAGLLCVGTAPLGLVLNRPETLLVILFLSMLIVALEKNDLSWKSRFLYPAILLLISLLALSTHPKTLFFLPFVYAAIFQRCKCSKTSIVLMGGVTVFAALIYRFYSEHTACLSDANVSARVAKVMLSPKMLTVDPAGFFRAGIQNFVNSTDYFKWALYLKQQMSDWLPMQTKIGDMGKFGNVVAKTAFFAQAGIIGAGIIVAKQGRGVFDWISRTKLLWSLLAGLFAFGFFQSAKGSYESAFVLPLFSVAAVLSLEILKLVLRGKLVKQSVPLFALVFLLSLTALLWKYVPIGIDSWSKPGPIMNQRFSFVAIHYDRTREAILELAKQCKLETEGMNRLVIDDLTYPVFWKNHNPIHALYISNEWRKSILDIKAFLRSQNASGWITDCRNLPKEEITNYVEKSGVCCAPKF
jgi:hypothetical protein